MTSGSASGLPWAALLLAALLADPGLADEGKGGPRKGFAAPQISFDKSDYVIGDSTTISVYVPDECYLYVVDYGSSRRIFMMFPNDTDHINRIAAGTTISSGGSIWTKRLKQGPPAGEDIMYAFCSRTPDPVSVGPLDGSLLLPPDSALAQAIAAIDHDNPSLPALPELVGSFKVLTTRDPAESAPNP